MSKVIVGIGSFLPARVVTNDDIQDMGTDFDRGRARGLSLDEWARARHGGRSRRWAAPDEATAGMATKAARCALRDAGLGGGDVDLIVMSTFTGDYVLPQAVTMVQAEVGSGAKCIQVDSACAGFVDALLVADGLMEAHGYRTALVIGAEKVTCHLDPRNCIPRTVFGDGAGAVVLRESRGLAGRGLVAFSSGSDGSIGDYVWIPGGGSRQPLTGEAGCERASYLRFKWSRIRKWAIDCLERSTREAVAKAGLTLDDIRWVVPHQASLNIIHDLADRLGMPREAFIITFPDTGNLSSASIPVALHDANRRSCFTDGDWVVFVTAGAGMAWGAAVYRWYDYAASREHVA